MAERYFLDKQDNKWLIEYNIVIQRLVKEKLGIDLDATSKSKKAFDVLFDDMFVSADMLYWVCRDQIEGQGLSREDFERQLDASAIEAGRMAIMRSYADFQKNPFRDAIHRNLDTYERKTGEILSRAANQLDDDKLEKLFDKAQTQAREQMLSELTDAEKELLEMIEDG